jgi:hypothetical protein
MSISELIKANGARCGYRSLAFNPARVFKNGSVVERIADNV